MSVSQAVDLTLRSNVNFVVVTGGEPLLQWNFVRCLIKALNGRGIEVQVESNGTIFPDGVDEVNAMFVISPKDICVNIPNARLDSRWIWLLKRGGRVYFKLLIDPKRALECIEEVEDFLRKYDINRDRIYLMPLTTGDIDVWEAHVKVLKIALERGFSFTPRLQILFGFK